MEKGVGVRLGWGNFAGLVLLVSACGDKSNTPTSPDTGGDAGGSSSGGASSSSRGSSSGGTATGGGGSSSGGTGTGGAATSSGGVSVAGGSAGEAGAGGEGGDATTGSGGTGGGEPWCVPEEPTPADNCVYPESLGGGDAPDACGVTPAAWYPLGDSELVAWPERASDEGVSGSFGITSGEDPQLLLNDDGTGFLLVSCNAFHWDGASWEPLPLPEWTSEDFPDWTGEAFQCVGSIDQTGRLAIALTIDFPANEHYDAFYRQLHLIRSLDSGWEHFGVIASSSDVFYDYEATDYTTVFDSSNHPVVLYRKQDIHTLHVKRWDGQAWSPFASEADVNAGNDSLPFPDWDIGIWAPRLLLSPDDRPVVAAAVDEFPYGPRLFVAEWTGNAWSVLPTIDAPEFADVDSVTRASLKLMFDTGGNYVLSWLSGDELEMFVWSGSSWQHVPATEQRLEALPEHVRWYTSVEASGGSDEVRVRRFEDCRWTGWSASDRDGGVSNSALPTKAPSLAVATDRVCVAWSTLLEDDWRVLLRCHD